MFPAELPPRVGLRTEQGRAGDFSGQAGHAPRTLPEEAFADAHQIELPSQSHVARLGNLFRRHSEMTFIDCKVDSPNAAYSANSR